MSSKDKVLVVNSSARKNRSMTRKLTSLFEETYLKTKKAEFIYRDVGMSPPHIINEDWIDAAFTSEIDLTPTQKEL
jgi:FMN-dependent NADH-azoreductase